LLMQAKDHFDTTSGYTNYFKQYAVQLAQNGRQRP
jgi:hypothetical protein